VKRGGVFTVECKVKWLLKLVHVYNLPPHVKSVAALPCEIWMFSCTILHDIPFNSVTNRLFNVNIYRNVIFWITWLCQLICNITACVQNIRHQHARMLCFVHATLSMDTRHIRVNDALLQCCAKRIYRGAVAIYCADMISNDVIGTQKRQLSVDYAG